MQRILRTAEIKFDTIPQQTSQGITLTWGTNRTSRSIVFFSLLISITLEKKCITHHLIKCFLQSFFSPPDNRLTESKLINKYYQPFSFFLSWVLEHLWILSVQSPKEWHLMLILLHSTILTFDCVFFNITARAAKMKARYTCQVDNWAYILIHPWMIWSSLIHSLRNVRNNSTI